nr:hypothetical protein [Tanacetum cinerariifolium]
MSAQQDIYAASFENRPPRLNKENYVPWLSRLRYAKNRPNRKIIYNSIMNGPYVRRMIHEPGDANRKVPVNETFHEHTYNKLTEKELKQVEADDQAIQTILLGLPENIYAAIERSRHVTIVHQTKDLHTADYTQLYYFLKYNQKGVDNLRAERLAKTHDLLAFMANFNNPFTYLVFHQDQPSSSTYMQQSLPNNNSYNPQPSFNQKYMQQPMPSLEDITDPTTAINMELVLMANAFKLNSQHQPTTTREFHQTLVIGRFLNRIANQNLNGNGNVVVVQTEGNAIGNNDSAVIAQKEEAGIQLQAEEFDLMVGAADLDEIEEVNANCILMANLQQASTSGTKTDKTPVYDSDGSAKVHNYDNCYDNEKFNMFTQEDQYTEQLEPIPEPHQVQQNDSNVIFDVSSVERDEGTVDQHLVTVEETHAYFESL